MKRIIFLIIGLLLIALVVYLNDSGLVTWQPLAIILAAIAAPFKFMMGLFNDKNIHAKHQELREKEKKFQQDLDISVREHQKKIKSLDEKLARLENDIDTLDKKRSEVDNLVNNMDADAIRNAVWKYAGK